MDYKIHLTVRVYVDEHMDMEVLKSHNRQYGINGKEIIAPLRKVNGMEYCIRDVSEEFKVEDLWHWIDCKVYGDSVTFSVRMEYGIICIQERAANIMNHMFM